MITWIAFLIPLHAEEHSAVKAGSGRFEVTQEFQGDTDQGDGVYLETVRFRDAALPKAELSGSAWPGIYIISPNEQWLIRTQKIGSGQSIAILYKVEENGRVSEVVGFDDLLWGALDTVPQLKQEDLSHAGIAKVAWSEDNRFLEVVLRGSNASNSGDRIEIQVQYDLANHRAIIKEGNSDQEVSPNP